MVTSITGVYLFGGIELTARSLHAEMLFACVSLSSHLGLAVGSAWFGIRINFGFPGNIGVHRLRALTLGGLAVAVLLALFVRTAVQNPAQASPQPNVHTYYIAADEVHWNYLPGAATYALGGENEINPVPRPKSNTYLKAVYHEYTDASFTTLKPRPPEWEHLGILGPLIRAEVGDVVKVVFKNNSQLNCTMHPH